jgi:predicted acyl esterase
MRRTTLVLFTTMALVGAACASSDGTTDTAATEPPTTAETVPETDPEDGDSSDTSDTVVDAETEGAEPSLAERLPEVEPDFSIAPGVEQVAITGAEPGTPIVLVTTIQANERLDPDAEVAPYPGGIVDDYGSLLIRDVPATLDHQLVIADASITAPMTALDRTTHPDQAFYAEQRLAPGLNYIEMRDGTTLSANVVLPGPIEDGPYPTVVEYSGYTPADPEGSGFKDLFTPLGYAYVGVNMRGTGCSGGSFRYFEYAQSIDGYDAIEAVAAQPWVFENRPGMVGVSYPGISQLFVAQTQPPSLAAITPFSVIDDTYTSTLYPGGLLNTGFAVEWTQDRVDNGKPAIDPDGNILDEGGQGWAKDQISSGDEVCAVNQSLRAQNPDLVSEVLESPFYNSRQGDELSPRLFVDQITVPTFVAGAWQDEQTGGRFPTMLDQFTGTDHLYATLMNGLHTESIGPANFARWVEFLDLYVAKRVPTLETARFVAPVLAGGIFGTTDFTLPDDRFASMTYDEALAAFEAEPPIRVLFEVGAGNDTPRAPVANAMGLFDSWPIPAVEPTEWWLGQDSALLDIPEADNGRAEYLALPDGVPATFYEGNSSDIWRTDVQWDWQEPAAGTVAGFLTQPLGETVTMVGSGSADLWVSSNLGDTDLEVTLTEVRPDGQETYVQSGWLRASHRQLDDARSTPLQPIHTHLEADVEPLPDGITDTGFALARVEIFPFAHVFRAGSQVRISIDAPGGNRPVWVFDTISGGEQVTIGLGGDFPSKVVLPVVPGIDAPADYPECGALRGQPCRPFTG